MLCKLYQIHMLYMQGISKSTIVYTAGAYDKLLINTISNIEECDKKHPML